MSKKEFAPGQSAYSSAENGRSTFLSPHRPRIQFRSRPIRAGLRCYRIRLVAHAAAFRSAAITFDDAGLDACRMYPYAVVTVNSANA